MKFLISPPFGNWIGHPNCTSVIGSLTWERRPGLIYHALKTVRKVDGGWINKIGLRNPGIRSIADFKSSCIYSLVGLEDGDWERMLEFCPIGLSVEVNLGCPNVHQYGIPSSVLKAYCEKFKVIAKLPPTDKVDDIAAMCIETGVKFLHCCNTLPTSEGGVSGERLFHTNMPIVKRLSTRYPGTIIAGGGIYSPEHVGYYKAAGASSFSLSTVWLTPWKVKHILNVGLGNQEQ